MLFVDLFRRFLNQYENERRELIEENEQLKNNLDLAAGENAKLAKQFDDLKKVKDDVLTEAKDLRGRLDDCQSFSATKDETLNRLAKQREELLAEIERLKGPGASGPSVDDGTLYSRLSRMPITSQELRFKVLYGYGFTPEAIKVCLEFPLYVSNLQLTSGGGLTWWNKIELNTAQHQAALHEFSHWAWQRMGLQDQRKVANYLEAYKRLAVDPSYPDAREYAKLQLYGDSAGFPGVLELKDYDHALVSLASWHMGRYKNGPRKLPEYMWPFFEPLFTGEPILVPYYMQGGVQ